MSINRRDFIKAAGVGLGGLALADAPLPSVHSLVKQTEAENQASMLYDATKCIGCRACQTACKTRSNLAPVTDPEGIWEAPRDLSADTWTIIKLYEGEEGASFVKANCMHCIEPACASVCPVGALEKTEAGPVVYHAERCIGCRYCMAACPFGIPKAQWPSNTPKIQKCDFCADKLAKGEQTACAEACPTGAISFGSRKDMLAVAHGRIEDTEKYVSRVYGEIEAGGTDVLYITGVNPLLLGLPDLDDRSLPAIDWPYMKAVPWVIGIVGSLMTATYFFTHRNENKEVKDGH